MRTWIKATIGGAALVAVCILALGGTAGYYVFRSFEKTHASEAAAILEMDGIKARFGVRPPLVEIINPRSMDVRVNRLASSDDGARVQTVHVVNWKAEDGEVVRMEVPLWLMRFSSLNIFSQMGLAPEKIRLTVQDIERYGPGVVVDYNRPGATHLLVWVD
jgi:hypothetical protein